MARKLSDLPAIQGSGFLLPLGNATPDRPRSAQRVRWGLRHMLDARPERSPDGSAHDGSHRLRHHAPPEAEKSDYRLTLVYFQNWAGRRPSASLHSGRDPQLAQNVSQTWPWRGQDGDGTAARLGFSDKQLVAYHGPRYVSVPYLLARAYGGAYLWQQLEAVLHHKRLDPPRVIANAAPNAESHSAMA